MKTFDITAGYEEYFTRYPILDAEGVASIGYAPAKMAPSERLFLWALAYGLRPATYLEIGSLEGGSALIVSAALDTLRCAGRMALIEPEPRILPEVWARIAPRATLHRALSPQAIPEAVAALGGPVELAFIDGDHSPEGARADAEGLLPHMAAGSYMLFHDAFFPDVKTAVDAFVLDHADRIVDCGTPTREVTHDPEDEEKRPVWGGLRMIHVTTG